MPFRIQTRKHDFFLGLSLSTGLQPKIHSLETLYGQRLNDILSVVTKLKGSSKWRNSFAMFLFVLNDIIACKYLTIKFLTSEVP